MINDDKLSHDELTVLAEKWLKKKNCGVTFNDKFKALTSTGEQPDALGMRQHVSVMVECKCSKRDFVTDANKAFRKQPDLGVGDWRFYLCPERLIYPDEIPDGWGLLWVVNGKVKEIFGVPTNTQWQSNKPFTGNKEVEFSMMYSALRRLTNMDLFGNVYSNKK